MGLGDRVKTARPPWPTALLPVPSPQDLSGKKTEPRTIHEAVFSIHRD